MTTAGTLAPPDAGKGGKDPHEPSEGAGPQAVGNKPLLF